MKKVLLFEIHVYTHVCVCVYTHTYIQLTHN